MPSRHLGVPLRNFFSLILLLGAALSAFAGATLHWVHHTAHDPAPVVNLATEIATDQAVTDELGKTVAKSIESQLPSSDNAELSALVSSAVQAGVEGALSDEGVRTAWEASLNESREQLVTDLATFRESAQHDAPSLWFDAQPFIELIWNPLMAAADGPIGKILAEFPLPEDIRVEVYPLPQNIAVAASDALALASFWWVAYALAVVFALGGLLLGTGAIRWVLLGVAGLFNVALVALVGFISGRLPLPTGSNELVNILTRTVADHLAASLNQWLTPLWYVSWVVLLGGAVAAFLTHRRHHPVG